MSKWRLVLVALIAAASVAAVAGAGHEETAVRQVTGCLTPGGTIVKVALGTQPRVACPPNQERVHLSGGDVTKVEAGAGLVGGGDSGAVALALDAGQLLPQSCAQDQVPKWRSSWTCGDDEVGWALAGNGGTDPAKDFLGTTDARPLVVKVGGKRALLLEPNGVTPNVIGGSERNRARTGIVGATVGGGGGAYGANVVEAPYSTVGGGLGNSAGAILGPGNENVVDAASTVGGGAFNVASGLSATIAGGEYNVASGNDATVAGGFRNTASGAGATVLGGSGNGASGGTSLAWGFRSFADAVFGVALGVEAVAKHDGAIVVSAPAPNTRHANDEFLSTAENEFAVRAVGGARFVSAVDVAGAPTAGVVLASGGGSWTSISDRTVKENLAPVDPFDILRRLVSIPIRTWNYKSQPSRVRHIGPTAQDFAAAFGVGESDRGITTVDADGVAFAAIQGLYRLVERRDARLRAQSRRIAELEARLAALERALEE